MCSCPYIINLKPKPHVSHTFGQKDRDVDKKSTRYCGDVVIWQPIFERPIDINMDGASCSQGFARLEG